MLPGAPMDGGRVLRALLWRHYGDRVRAALAATRVGRFVGFGLIVLGLAEFLLWANVVGGMWLMIIGWFLESAARAEAAATLASAALAGLRVSDVMTPDPDIAPGWNTIQDFVDRVAAHSRVSAFPVVGFDGHFAGIVVTDQLAAVRPQDRAVLRLDQVALAVPPGYLVAPDDPAGSLLGRPPLGGQVAGVVLDQGRVVGLVTTSDVSWAMQRARLRRESGAAPTDQRSGHRVHS